MTNQIWVHLYVPGTPSFVFSSSFPPHSDGFFAGLDGDLKEREKLRPRVLVVDDERLIADSITAILNRSGFDATARYGGAEAIEFIKGECPDIVLSDVMMPETNGVQLARAVRAACPRTRIVLISGNAATPNLLEHALPDGSPFELLAKPIHPTQLLSILRS